MSLRFRTLADERRYLALRTELYLLLAEKLGRTDPLAVSDLLRNLGKLEAFIYSEGIRQGACALRTAPAAPSPEEAHRRTYGAHDTPLADHEPDEPFFSRTPIDFAPLTLAEARARLTAQAVPEPSPLPTPAAPPAPPAPTPSSDPPALRPLLPDLEPEPTNNEASLLPDLEPTDADFAAELARIVRPENDPSAPRPAIEVPDSPQLLDQIREALRAATRSGWKPADWSELILYLHRTLTCDAFVLDLHLSGVQGRTILDQCGLFELRTPEALDVRFFEQFHTAAP